MINVVALFVIFVLVLYLRNESKKRKRKEQEKIAKELAEKERLGLVSFEFPRSTSSKSEYKMAYSAMRASSAFNQLVTEEKLPSTFS